MFELVRLILNLMRRTDWMLVMCCIVLILLQVYLDLRIPEFMNEITDHLQMGMDSSIIVRDGTGMLVCALLSLVMSIGAGMCAARFAASLSASLRKVQFDRVQSFSKEDINSFSAASLITRSTNDVYNVQQFVTRGLQFIVKSPILAIWAMAKISQGDFRWTATTLVAMVAMVTVMYVILSRFKPYTEKVQWLMDGVNRFTKENLEGSKVIRAYNAEGMREDMLDDANVQLRDNNLKMTRIVAPMHPFIHSMNDFLILAIYWVGAGLIAACGETEGKMLLFSDMLVFSSYATMVLTSVMMLTGVFRQLPRAMVSMRRIEEVVEHEPTLTEGACDERNEGGVSVEFDNVTFRYPGSDVDVLGEVSFKVEPGQTLAIIGLTGSGKSSLVNLIPRLYDVTSGRVLVDGRDVREYTLEALHDRMGYVPQNAVIFSGSVRENVNFGEGSGCRGDETIWQALDTAQASAFVDSLGKGLDSEISQHGRNVSGGQKQRIGIARAVCRTPGLYIFDDSFSALDFRTDRDLRAALKKRSGDATKIIVAQRIGTITDADVIVVLDGGRVTGLGTHSQLLRSCPLYREMAESQMLAETPS